MHIRSRLAPLAVLLLAGCAAAPQPTTTPEATLNTTALAQGIADSIFSTLTAQPTDTLQPSATASPSPTVTVTLTPTPATPFIVANERVPLRVGPGREFGAGIGLEAGTPMPVLGVSEDGRWAQVTTPEGEIYSSGGWVGLSPQITVHGDLSNAPIGDLAFITATPNVEMLAVITATAAAEQVMALIPPTSTPAATLDVPVLVSTVQVAVVETLIANVTQQVADQATQQAARQLAVQATQTASAAQPADVDADDDPAIGPADAQVVVIEFSDFTCPHCRNFALDTMPRLLADYGDRVRFVFRDAPILGPDSGWTALAAECADDQGKFWEYHDLLFENQGSLDRAGLSALAEQLELDVETFDTCVDDQVHVDELRNDLADAQNASLTGTPTFFINGQRIEGAQPYEVFAAVLDEELAKVGLPTGPAERAVEVTEAAAPEQTPDATATPRS